MISSRLIDRLAGIALAAIVAMTLLFLLAPLVVTAALSFDARPFLGPFPPARLSLQWYQRFATDGYFLQGLRTSLIIALFVTVLSTVTGTMAALFLRRSGPIGRELLMSLFMSPLIVPPVVIGFSLLLALSAAGMGSGWPRLVCGHLVITLPYAIRAGALGLASVPRKLEEAALSLGATRKAVLFTVTLPLARGSIVVGAIFAFVVSMDDVAVSMFLASAESFTLPVALVSSMRANFDLSIAAISTLFTLVVLLVVLAVERAIGLSRLFGSTHD